MADLDSDMQKLFGSIEKLVARVESLYESISEVKEELRQQVHIGQKLEAWKAETNERLAHGVQRMDRIEESFKACVKKETAMAYVAGAAGGAALLMKMLGGG